jgi:hypothetical protein
MKTLPIDKGVPIPQSDIYTETIKALKVGDSFVLHGTNQAIFSLALYLGVTLEAHPIGNGHYRFWRVKPPKELDRSKTMLPAGKKGAEL